MTAEFSHEDRKQGIRNTVIALLLLITVLLALFLNRVLTPRVLSPQEMVANGAVMFSTPREISAFNLLDKHGAPFTLDVLRGKWSFVFFGFTYCPDICPTTLALFNELARNLEGSDYLADTQFVLVSLDPARDTPVKLKQYIDYFNPQFAGATGDFLQLRKFATQLNVAFKKVVTDHETGDYTIDHGGNVALVNPQGHYHGFYKPPLDPNKMAITYKSVRLQQR
ncbi:MAG: SCO family protein [Pseudomonadales bacterium]|nr:SCO family protein [Gammaproteobacteria bacterium]NNL57612.1 SCO family protein [Pseudomonadales bacterium]